jgi:hypothetical protein
MAHQIEAFIGRQSNLEPVMNFEPVIERSEQHRANTWYYCRTLKRATEHTLDSERYYDTLTSPPERS